MIIPIIIAFVFIVLLAIIVRCILDYYDYAYYYDKTKDAKTRIKVSIVCFAVLLILSILGSILNSNYSKGKTVEIIPISEIYSINNDQYLITDNDGKQFTINFLDVIDVVKGDDAYVIFTTYPNSSGLSKFLIGGPEDKCTIVLDDFNIQKLDDLTN